MKKLIFTLLFIIMALGVLSSCFGNFENDECKHENLNIIPGREATCAKNGLTEGKSCLDCGMVFSTQQTIKKTDNHKYEVVDSSPACFSDGEKVYECSVCEDTYTETVPAGTHDTKVVEVLVSATCELGGSERRACNYCEYTAVEETPALGHQLSTTGTTVIDGDTYSVIECHRLDCDYETTEFLFSGTGNGFNDNSDTDNGRDTNTDSSNGSDTNRPSNSDTNSDSEVQTVTLILDANGGVLPEGAEQVTTYRVGTKVRKLVAPTKENAEFLGWYNDDGAKVTAPFTIEEDTYLTASWSTIADIPEPEETVTITLFLNGGKLPDGYDESFEAEAGSSFGNTLPTPTRPGYTFLGWFEDGNERWEVDKKTKVEDYDMEIHALWEANGDIVTVEFYLSYDETLEAGANYYFEMIAGHRLSDFITALPTATKEGYKFSGWKNEATGNRVSLTTKVTSDLRLSPVWTKIILCHDGTENHQWNAWQDYSEATCTTPAQQARSCNVCGGTEYNTTQEATGHKFGTWATAITENGIVRSRTCVECDDKEADPLTNIAFDSFKTPVVDGDCWGSDYAAKLFDGDYTMSNRTIVGKGTGAIVVTTEAKELTYVDMIAVTGYGSSTYNVVVTYENGDTKDLGMGSFGQGDSATKTFNVNATITKIVITMGTCSIGNDYWIELSVLVVPQ